MCASRHPSSSNANLDKLYRDSISAKYIHNRVALSQPGGIRLRLSRRHLPALGALPPSLICHPLVDDWFELRVEVGAVESDFFDED